MKVSTSSFRSDFNLLQIVLGLYSMVLAYYGISHGDHHQEPPPSYYLSSCDFQEKAQYYLYIFNVLSDLLLPSKGNLNFKNKNTELIFELALDGMSQPALEYLLQKPVSNQEMHAATNYGCMMSRFQIQYGPHNPNLNRHSFKTSQRLSFLQKKVN